MRRLKFREALPYALVAGTLSVTLFRGLREPNPFAMSHWLLDYRFGFMKRALVGSLCGGISSLTGHPLTRGAIVLLSGILLAAFFTALVLLLAGVLRRLSGQPFALLAALVFATSPFMVMSGHLIGYFDGLVYLFAAGAVVLVLSDRPLAAAAVSTVALLAHESYLLVGLPLVMFASCLRCLSPEGPHAWRRHAAALVLPVLVFVGISLALEGNHVELRGQVVARLSSRDFTRNIAPHVAKWLTTGFSTCLREQGPLFRERLLAPTCVTAGLPSLVTLLVFIHAAFRIRPFGRDSLLLHAAVLSPLCLHAVAWDGERIATYPVCGALFSLWILSRTRPATGDAAAMLPAAIPALLVNIFTRTPLMDGEVERLNDPKRLVLYAPALLAALFLLFRHAHRPDSAETPRPPRDPAPPMTPIETLTQLLADIFLLDPSEVRMDMSRSDLPTWDSLAVVSIAVGVHQTFGYHFTPAEANGIQTFQDIIDLLKAKGVWNDAL